MGAIWEVVSFVFFFWAFGWKVGIASVLTYGMVILAGKASK